MLNNKHKKELGKATRASVQKEMAKPRMSKSARIAELNLDASRIPEQPRTSVQGTVNKIIPSTLPSQPENRYRRCRPQVSRSPYRKFVRGRTRRRGEAQKGC